MGELKQCVGCGRLSAEHPIVAVMHPQDVPEGVQQSMAGPYGFVAVSVCRSCHEQPTTRARQIKGAFFEAKDAMTALAYAGSNVDGGGIRG